MSWNVSVAPGTAESFDERARETAKEKPFADYLTTEGAPAQFEAALGAADAILVEGILGDELGSCNLAGHVDSGDPMSAASSISVNLTAKK